MALKRDEIADPNSCFNRAADDEPIFILRGTDPLTPKLICDWAARAVVEGVHEFEKVQRAVRYAEYVRAWQIERGGTPAAPIAQPAGDDWPLESSD